MASHYEQSQTVKQSVNPKSHIDFYRQSDQAQNQVQLGMRNANVNGNKLLFQRTVKDYQNEGGTAFANEALKESQQDPSPIYDMRLNNRPPINDNFMETHIKLSDVRQDEIKAKQMHQDRLKRRSIENKEAILNSKSRGDLLQFQDQKQNQGRHLLNGAKSALSNYGTSHQPNSEGSSGVVSSNTQGIKQINKLTKVERDPIMMVDQQQMLKRSLAKSSSQNKLLFVSPETLLNKNNPYQDTESNGNNNAQDKNSFFKDQSNRSGTGNQVVQDLLYKQHMQYSSGATGNHQKGWQLKASNNNLLLSGMTTRTECTFCNKTSAGANSHSIIPHHCSAIYCSKDQQGMMIQNNLSKKYSTNRDYYNLKIVNDLIYNENTHIVSIFKDYLILDDINEFLKRSYNVQETKVRLPKLCSFYDKYSQVFPNYVCLPESKYMFKNIQRKQKLIDEQYQLQEELAKKQHQTLLDEDKLFNTKFYNSYYSNMGDLSMTKKQYEDQAKQIATQAGKKVPQRGFAQMRIDELVDRFLMKDSESNIQLITTAGLDFSGFTQHQNSTFINQHHINAPAHHNPSGVKQTPNKQASNQKSQQRASQQMVQQQQQPPQQQVQKAQARNAKKSSEEKRKPQQANVVLAQTSASNKRGQKGSFNNSGKSNQQVPKLDSIKVGLANESAKVTPRLNHQQKGSSGQAPVQIDLVSKQTIQTSPQTKEAILNYLHNCQIEPSTETHQLTNSLAQMGPLLSPNSNGAFPNNTNYMESPSIKSLSTFSQKPTLLNSGSQTSLKSHAQQFQQTQQSRQNMKSQCIIPTITLANATLAQKKTNRLSHGGNQKPLNQHRKNASPTPQQQQYTQSRNNQNVVSNSTQKSVKSINSHAKYLSGGNDQYQKLLVNAQQNQQQQTYQTNYENTMNSHLINSSSKKVHGLQAQRSKQDLILETFVGSQNSNQKKQITNQLYNAQQDNFDNEGVTVTNEDCDDFGIADERFASPDCHNLMFSTVDDNIIGRKSIESTNRNVVHNPQQMLMLTSTEDKILSGSNNFDQIKKHLEQYISSGKGIGQPLTFDHRSVVSQKSNLTRSNEKAQYEDVKQSMSSAGYNRDNMTQSAHSQANQSQQDQSNSRNGTGQKTFESLKQRIRGVFDTNQQHTSDSLATNNKTPIKGSTHQKKAQVNLAATQNLILQQNRMSLESNQAAANMLLMPTSNSSQQNHPLPLSSTSAAGKQLQFSQQQQRSFQQNAANYRSITNLQQRKGSNQKYDNSVEAKRLSQQHQALNRQSFKDLGGGQQNVQTVVNQQSKVIKRCATGKTLNLQDVNAHSHTFGQMPQGYLNPGSSTSTLCNPTFISTTSTNNPSHKMYQTATQNASIVSAAAAHQQMLAAQQQQAANTVRVMTPSYSLASLSKLISPQATNTTSPMTMTVTNANGQTTTQVIGRKQVLTTKGKATAMGHHPANHHQYTGQATLMPSHSQNYLIPDNKGQKMMTTQSTALGNKGVIASKGNVKQQMTRTNNTIQTQMNPTTGISLSATLNQKIGRQQNLQHTMQQSNSLSNLQQITPRGVQQEKKPQIIQVGNHFENSGNLSCTVSTENNSSKYYMLSDIAAKAIESKHPKFMQTIEEHTTNQAAPQYNTMLSATMGHGKSGTGLASSMSQAQLDVKMQKQKIQTAVNSGQNTIKRSANIQGQTLQSSQSVSHFKHPSQQMQSKRSLQGRQ